MKKKIFEVLAVLASLSLIGCIPGIDNIDNNNQNVDIIAEPQIPDEPKDNESDDKDTEEDIIEESEVKEPQWVPLKTSYYYDGYLDSLCEYDDKGRMSVSSEYENGVLTSWTEYVYDDDGVKIGSTVYYADGLVNRVESYIYDKFCSIINCQYTSYDSNGDLAGSNKVTYTPDDGTLLVENYYQGDLTGSYRSNYNDMGKLVSEKHMGADGIETYSFTYDYYDNGTIKSYNEVGYETGITEYDEKGNVIFDSHTDSDGNLYIRREYVNTYNDDGTWWTIASVYDGNGEISGKTEIHYNEKGLTSEYVSYDADGLVTMRTVSTYDDDNNILTYDEFGPDGYKTTWTEYSVDQDLGTRIWTTFREDGVVESTYKYYNNGNNYLTEYYIDNSLINHTDMEYDANGNMTKYSYYDENGNVLFWNEYEYQYIVVE